MRRRWTCRRRCSCPMAEHFRAAILPNRLPGWAATLPVLPYTTGEVKELIENQCLSDEQGVLEQLMHLGSASAQILTQLQLTRGIVKEALQELRDERRAQCNLLEVLSAARYKMVTAQGLVDTHCPLRACRARDSFSHMLECYDLQEHVARGAASVPFLVRMARKTQILDLSTPRPYWGR